MENPLGNVQQRKTISKKSKSKKKSNNPVKVVYISNPMKMNASPSEFRALVQKFTGQDADPSMLLGTGDAAENENSSTVMKVVDETPSQDNLQEYPNWDIDLPYYEPFTDDDVYTAQMLENFSAIFPSSILLESSHMDMVRSLDAV